MRITVLVTQSRKESIPRLKDFLDQRFISSSFYLINADWSLNGGQKLLGILRDSFDFLIVCEQTDLDAIWVPYITGYSHERNQDDLRRINTVFFIEKMTAPLPRWLKQFPVMRSYYRLNAFFIKVNALWHKINDAFVANYFIKTLGYDNLHTPVLEGDKKKDLLLLELYIEGGGNPNYVDEEGVPLLCQILRKDEKKLAFHLIQRGCDINLIARDRETTPLMEAASRGYEDLVSLFIERGAQIEHQSKEGQTALILAMGNQNLDTARVLIEAGADGLAKDHLEMSALKYARLYGYDDMAAQIEGTNE